ncbi:molybdopterin molybdotransferase MoeA [Streptomyces pratensis]|uniref:molybdopterin molybdotransferase MoeA n=1 Tax=Streptomyces pratensis TaxID=1169025 RepID=UPI003019F0AE
MTSAHSAGPGPGPADGGRPSSAPSAGAPEPGLVRPSSDESAPAPGSASGRTAADDARARAASEEAVEQALALVSGVSAAPGHACGPAPCHAGAAASGHERDAGTAPANATGTAPANAAGAAPATTVGAGRAHAAAPGRAHDTTPGRARPLAPTLSWDRAREVAARSGRSGPPAVIRLPLDRALGHVLAEALGALTDLPPFDTSAMDGWAVAGPGPWTFDAGAGLLAGRVASAPLPDGTAVRIATGARVPGDTTAVIRAEHAHADAAKGVLHAQRPVVTGQDVRPRGQECRSGEQLVPAGAIVTPAVLGLAAAAGYDALPVAPRPRVDVLVLGDELLAAGLPHEGLIRDALGPMLGPWLRAVGAQVQDPRRLGDDAGALRAALVESDADLIVTTGGTASGPVDHVHRVLGDLGAELLVDGVAVRPGHPMLLARLPPDGPYLVGLPGNPLAAVSGLLTLAEPLLAGIAGRPAQDPYLALVHAEVPGHPHDTRLVPVVHRAGRVGGRDHVAPLRYNGPAMLRGIAAADGLAVVPPGGVRSGTEVEILDLPWAPATPWTEGCFT